MYLKCDALHSFFRVNAICGGFKLSLRKALAGQARERKTFAVPIRLPGEGGTHDTFSRHAGFAADNA